MSFWKKTFATKDQPSSQPLRPTTQVPDGSSALQSNTRQNTQASNTEIINAVKGGDVVAVQALLDEGADVNAKETDDWTPLMWASAKGYIEVVVLLLDKGADVNAKNTDGYSALMLASQNGHDEVVQALLAKGADVNAKGFDGGTALISASKNGYSEVVQALIVKGADVNTQGTDGYNALILASKNGHDKVVQVLLATEADVKAKAFDGGTALTLASNNGHRAVVQALLDKDANVNYKMLSNATNARTTVGDTALQTLTSEQSEVVGSPPLRQNADRGWPGKAGVLRWALTSAETRVLEKPSELGTVVSVLKAGEEVDFVGIEKSGGKKWCKVKLENGQLGYVSEDTAIRRLLYVKLEQKLGEMRDKPEATGNIIRQLVRNDTFLIVNTLKSGSDDWVRIRCSDGQEGFLHGKTKIKQLEVKAIGNSPEHDMLVGALWCIGGIVATAIGYSSANDAASRQGGSQTYFIFWGAIVFGGIQFLKGLFRSGFGD